jgi:hypothetical protein
MGILFKKKGQFEVIRYNGANWVGDMESHRSTEGYAFQLGANPITYYSKRQQIVALSSIKAKYRALIKRNEEYFWLKGLLLEFKVLEDKPIKL